MPRPPRLRRRPPLVTLTVIALVLVVLATQGSTSTAPTRLSPVAGTSRYHPGPATPQRTPPTAPSPASQPARAPTTWQWPLPSHPRILRDFLPPPEPWLAGHRGTDLAAPPGTPVLAAGPGVVGYAGELAGRGVVVVLHPNGLRTTYLPVVASVRQGDPVTTGTRLGVVQDRPGHCHEPCLHWGLLRTDHYLDPLLLVGLGVVRLLPYWETRSPS
ncbi:M23 family metallopeptidase [Thermoactinospora rubra]|uniref:M23 family metallopeptidase n=1 Tax=Thermoactinospora rubra TaxID=1088767 RepID=UPI000A11EB09|nr:M23 family metallopeptidase [Thermoactinospora rubra]